MKARWRRIRLMTHAVENAIAEPSLRGQCPRVRATIRQRASVGGRSRRRRRRTGARMPSAAVSPTSRFRTSGSTPDDNVTSAATSSAASTAPRLTSYVASSTLPARAGTKVISKRLNADRLLCPAAAALRVDAEPRARQPYSASSIAGSPSAARRSSERHDEAPPPPLRRVLRAPRIMDGESHVHIRCPTPCSNA